MQKLRDSVPPIAAAALVLLALMVLFTGASTREVHGTAALYASLARSIAESGSWLGIFTGPEAYLLKPPLVIWLTAAAVELFGPTSLAATLGCRLTGLAMAGLTWLLARRLYGPAAAWCAVLVLLTNSTFHQFATALRMDAALMCGVLMAMLGYLYGDRRWGPALLFGGIAVAVLAKGPPGLLPLALLPLHWLVARPALAAPRYWLAGSVLLLLPLAWYAWLIAANGDRVWLELAADINRGHRITLQAQLASAVKAYVVKPLVRFWPGLPFMLAGLVMAIAGLRRGTRAGRATGILLLTWVALVVGAASAKPDHDIRYLFIALPALATLGGMAAARLLGGRIPVWLTAVVAVLALALPVAGVVIEPDDRSEVAALRAYLDEHLPPGAPVTVVGTNPNNRPGPRRQHSEFDWTHYYLGRPARMQVAKWIEAGDLRAEPFVLVARYVRDPATLERLRLRVLLETEEVSLAVPGDAAPAE